MEAVTTIGLDIAKSVFQVHNIRASIRDKLAETGYMAGGSRPTSLESCSSRKSPRWSALIKSISIKLD
jgi:hypothetical protein